MLNQKMFTEGKSLSLAGLHRFLVSLLALVVAAAMAGKVAAAEQAPDELVREVTDKLLSDIATYRQSLEQISGESEKQALLSDYYDHITATLEPVVDFDWIALNVMGKYGKQATAEQKERFAEVFTRGLVETYGRGLLTYSDQEIVVRPLPESASDQRRVTVNQQIRGKDETYPLQYSMGLNRDGDWKVINVIINGINLGQTFRNQFAQAASSHGGDIDAVIANWATKEVDTE